MRRQGLRACEHGEQGTAAMLRLKRLMRSGLLGPSPPTPPSGFTLIEVMVVLVIMSIMALLSWQGIQTMLKTREISLGLVTAVDSIQTATAQWRVDLDNTLSAPASAQVPSLDWDARVLRLVRRSSGPGPWGPMAGGNSGDSGTSAGLSAGSATDSPGVWVVAWSARSLNAEDLKLLPLSEQRPGLYWLRWQSPAIANLAELNTYWEMARQWGQNASTEARAFETVLFEIQNWQLYFYRNNTWSNALSSANTVGDPSSAAPSGAAPVTNAPTSMGSGLASSTNSGTGSPGALGGNNGNTNASNPSVPNGGTSPTNPNAPTQTTVLGSAFPDGVRLKLYLAPDQVLGSGVPTSGVSNPQNDPAITLDWVRLNFSTPKP